MSLLQLLILAIIQGLTEFLPISSSAHLILPSKILGWPDQGPMIDVMAHFGTLFAVMLYFSQDVRNIISGFFDLLRRELNQRSALALNLILATPPAVLLGVFLNAKGFDEAMRRPLLIASTFIIFGIILWWADVKYARTKSTEDLTWKGAITLGLAQSLALIPGTSRSGITMTAARMMDMTRVEAARFSMLMSLPIIGGGGLFALYKLSQAPADETATLGAGLIVAVFSFIAAYISIAFFMKLVSRIGMFPFMVYRVLLGLVIIVWVVMSGNAA